MKKLLVIIALSLLWCSVATASGLKNTLWRLNQSYYVLFIGNECKFHYAGVYSTPLNYDKGLDAVYEKLRKNNWGDLNGGKSFCNYKDHGSYIELNINYIRTSSHSVSVDESYYLKFTQDNRIIGSNIQGGKDRFYKVINYKYPPNIRGTKVILNTALKQKISVAANKLTPKTKISSTKVEKPVSKTVAKNTANNTKNK